MSRRWRRDSSLACCRAGIVGVGWGWLRADNLRLMVAVGFTGAYTTFSTFEYEANEILANAEWLKAMFYLAGSVVLGLIAVRLGVILARAM